VQVQIKNKSVLSEQHATHIEHVMNVQTLTEKDRTSKEYHTCGKRARVTVSERVSARERGGGGGPTGGGGSDGRFVTIG
jgi:hypothetical protein